MTDTASIPATAVADRPDSSRVAEEMLNGQGLSTTQAARMFPPKRADRPVSPATVFRWMTNGVGVPGGGGRLLLESCRVGCTLFTSRPALVRFIEAQNRPRPAAPPPVREPEPPVPPARRGRQVERAASTLEAAGL
jgi:hypothetical protein